MSGALTRNEDWRKNRLRLLREAEGLSQADLSHLLGVSQQMICK